MSVIAIAGRELRDRSRLFLVAAILAIVPFLVAPALRGEWRNGMMLVAAFLAIAYSAALALMLGVSTIGRELSEKRAAFLFARPVSPASIWFGKAGAALLICLGVFAIISLPVALIDRGAAAMIWRAAPLLLLFSWAMLFLGGHAASTMVRSRSPRIVLDLVFLVLAGIAMLALLRPILRANWGNVPNSLLTKMGLALLVVLLVAPVWQLAHGRIDPRRNHAALSTALWSGVAVILAVASAYVWWLLSPPLSAIRDVEDFHQSPNGEWMFVEGRTPDRGWYRLSYLVNTTTGKRERMAPLGDPQFSVDGRLMAWFEDTALMPVSPVKGRGSFRLYTRQLERGAKRIATSLVIPLPRFAQLSPDGTRIAIATAEDLEVYEIASGRLLAVFDNVYPHFLHFVGPDQVQCVQQSSKGLTLRTIDIGRRKVTIAELPMHWSTDINYAADGSRVFLTQERTVLDPRTGRVPVSLPPGPGSMTMLRDGSFVLTGEGKLTHLDPNGRITSAFSIPLRTGDVVAQISASKLLLETERDRMLIVDFATKEVVRSVSGVGPPVLLRHRQMIRQFPENARFVGVTPASGFVVWDSRTGTKRPL